MENPNQEIPLKEVEDAEQALSAFKAPLPKGEDLFEEKNFNLEAPIHKLNTKISKSLDEKSTIFNLQTSIPKLFRPPYGQITSKQGKKLTALGYKIIMWDVLSFDWDASVSEEKCLDNVISKSQSGSIIVFHDSVKASRNMQYALPKVLNYYTEKGFVFKTLSEENLKA